MVWSQIEATPPHKSYLLLSGFLILYTLFATFIRNRLHLSEPPLALIVGIILGPRGLGWLNPNECNSLRCVDEVGRSESSSWGWGDDVIQETARVIVGIQVFTVGIELPKHYATKHWKSVGMMLGEYRCFNVDDGTGLTASRTCHDFRLADLCALCLLALRDQRPYCIDHLRLLDAY